LPAVVDGVVNFGTRRPKLGIRLRYSCLAPCITVAVSRSVTALQLSVALDHFSPGGDPIKVQVKEPALGAKPTDNRGGQDENAELAEEAYEAGDVANDDDLGIASITNILHLLEGVAADGRKWLQEHAWATAWTGDEVSGAAEGFSP
jgi:hypothetical protein